MAKQIAQEPVIEDLDEMEVDEFEQELNEKAIGGKKEKKEKAPREPKIGENQIGASGIAEILGIAPRELRMFLRKHFRDMSTEKGKTYVWDKGSKEVQEIVDAYKQYKATPRKKAEPKEEKDTTKKANQPAQVPVVDLNDIDLDDEDM